MTPLEAALSYAARGWFVLPGHPQDKRPLTKGDNWSATTDEATIRGWWQTWPNALVGICVGPSNIVALDIDVHDDEKNGFQSLGSLCRALGHHVDWLDTISLSSRTGSGGKHHLFSAPAGVDLSKRRINWMPGVDVMLGTSFLILPPSVHPNGVPYEWARGPEDFALEPVPAELLSHLMASLSSGSGHGGDTSTTDMAGLLANGSRSGSRNQDLIRLIGWLRRTVGSDQEALAKIRAQLEEWRDRCHPPYRGGNTDDEFQRTWASGISLDHTDRNPNWPATEGLVEQGLARLTGFGLAGWFEPRVGARVRYHRGTSSILVWDGRRWAENDMKDFPLWPSLQEWGVIHQLERQINDEADGVPANAAKQLRLFLDRALDRRFCSEAVLTISQAKGRTVDRDSLDSHAEMLHCNNGVVNLRTGELGPHDPELLNTSLVPYDYDPMATSPALHAQLESMFPGDPEMQQYLQRAVGASLYGDNRAKALFIMKGPANTGKSTLLQALLPVLGSGTQGPYADVADKKLFIMPKNEQHPAGLADALAYRFILMSEEYGPGDKLNMPVLKAITGADRLKARQMRENFWSGEPRCTPWMATNHDLRFGEFDESVRTRLRIIDVPGVIEADRRRDNVRGELLAEAAGLLAWAVQGAVEYARAGLRDPQKVLDAVKEAVDDADRVMAFVIERLTIWGVESATPAILADYGMSEDDLWQAYEWWTANQGARPLYRSEFIKRLRSNILQPRGVDVSLEKRTADGRLIHWFPISLGELL